MTVLSIVAVARLAERRVRQAAKPLLVEDVVRWLRDSVGVEEDRARAGVRLAVVVCRLEGTTDEADGACLRLPTEREAGGVTPDLIAQPHPTATREDSDA